MIKFLVYRSCAIVSLSTLALTTVSLTSFNQMAIAKEYPDRPGHCFFFRNDILEMNEVCNISTGYGAGAMYTILNWSDGIKTKIFNITACKGEGSCGDTVDDAEAIFYERDLFLNPTEDKNEKEIPCYRISSSGNSVCYRFKD